MSEFHFGTGRGEVSRAESRRIERIAKRHGATFTNVRLPGDGWRYWLSKANEGNPFDTATAKACLGEIGDVRVKAKR